MTKNWIRIISILEIVGGLFGFIILIWWFLFVPFNTYSLLIVPIPIAIYVLCILAGCWLWKGHRFGRTASIIIQAIQLPKIFSPFIVFMFSFGFDVWIEFLFLPNGLTNLGFQIRFLSFNQLFFNVEQAPTGLGISITALIFLIMLFNYKPAEFVEETGAPPQPPTFEQN
jgi:hypothetical protein